MGHDLRLARQRRASSSRSGRSTFRTPSGLLYSAFTYFTGFKVNSGEYKLMGLAPYGQPKYADLILDKLLDLKDDGTFRLDMQYFNYCTGLTMTNEPLRRAVRRPAAHGRERG